MSFNDEFSVSYVTDSIKIKNLIILMSRTLCMLSLRQTNLRMAETEATRMFTNNNGLGQVKTVCDRLLFMSPPLK